MPVPLRRSNFPWPRPQQLPRDRRLPALYRVLAHDGQAEVAPGEGVRDAALAQVEAALFLADEPITPRRLAQVANVKDVAEVRRLARKLQGFYEKDQSAFQVEEVAGGFQLLTRPEFRPWLARLKRAREDLKLTAATRETLAIIAYRQPIMRADVEAIRGVQSGDALHHLIEKGLVKIAGRHDSLGRPMLYGTTRKFLQVFGLNSLKELPKVEELRALK